MSNKLTEVVFIIDNSGSMFHLVDDTIGGFNGFIEKQKAVETLCKREDFAEAIAALAPEGLHPNRQMAANYIRGKHFFMLTQLYRLKFGI